MRPLARLTRGGGGAGGWRRALQGSFGPRKPPRARPRAHAAQAGPTPSAPTPPPAQYALADKLALPVGFAAGMFGSVVGVGGGTIIVPALTACAGVAQRVVSGTSLVAVLATSAASSAAYYAEGLVDARAAAIVAAAALLSASAGARATAVLSAGQLKRALGFFLVGVAPLVPLKKALYIQRDSDASGIKDAAATMELSVARGAVLALTGACAGFASGLLGVGGGVIVTPMLALLTDLPQAAAVGTSLAAMFLPACVGLATHASMGNVRWWRMGAALAVGTAVGSSFGSRAAVQAPEGVLEGAFALGMFFLGGKTLKWF